MEDHRRQFVLSLIAYATQRDVSAQDLCRYSNVDLSSLKNDPSYTLSERQIGDLWTHASRLGNDRLFGLHFGESLQLSALGVVGEIVKSSRTVGDAVTMAASFIRAITDAFLMEVRQTKQNFSIRMVPTAEAGSAHFIAQQWTELLMAFIIHELDGLVLKKVKPVFVFIPYPVSDLKEYTRVLRCVPSKKNNEYAIGFDIQYWEEPVLSSNYELQDFLLQKAKSTLKDFTSDAFAARIHRYLMSNAYLGILSLDDVAANFNMTPRSFQRRLQAEGTTFQQLSDSVRKSLALHYIGSGKHQVKEISTMLGYNELSAFSRAFKRWTGKAPGHYSS